MKWLNNHSEAGKATQLCYALVVENNGVTYSDWFLPSKDELYLIYTKLCLKGVGGFAASYYWSSSELHALTAWNLYFGHGDQFNGYYKGDDLRVRAVRAF